MTREMLTKHWEIIKAFKEGKTIQYFNELGGWRDDENPSFGCNYNFRIKPESQLVPFSFEDADMFKGKWIKSKNPVMTVCRMIDSYGFDRVGFGKTEIDYFYLLENYTFLDGSPCGKLVETSNK